MPPRLSTSLQVCAELASSANTAASPLEHALLACRALPSASASRAFSTTSARQKRAPNHPKSQYHRWLKGEGKDLLQHKPGTPNYITKSQRGPPKPFPSNPAFISQEVLSEDAREEIYQRVAAKNDPIKVVSADLGVDHRRVAAIVRMKAIEKEWEREVCFASRPFPLIHALDVFSMMIPNKNSISLEDSTMWLQNSFASLSDPGNFYAYYL